MNILNRHPELLAGPETYLFMHPKLFSDWETNKRYLLRTSWMTGLKSEGWFRMNGTDLLQPFFQNTSSQLREMVHREGNLPAFSNAFFQKALQTKGARIWVEKSPSNALCFDRFLKLFPTGMVVHTTRNPYDTVASLVARGMTPFSAVAFYLINTSFALKTSEDSRHYLLKYEHWAQEPFRDLKAFLDWLGLPWSPDLLEPEEGAEVRMEGWLHNEKGPLKAGSIGRFGRLSLEQQTQIRCVMQQLRINPAYGAKYGLSHSSVREICTALNYAFQPVDQICGKGVRFDELRDRWARLIRLYPNWGKNYPVML